MLFKVKPISKSLSVGQVLFKDYGAESIYTIVLEMSDDLSERLRAAKLSATIIHFYAGFNQEYGGGITHQTKLQTPINLGSEIANVCFKILNKYYIDEPIRGINIAASGLVNSSSIQLSIFEDAEKKKKEEVLFDTIDKIRVKYGKNSVRRLSTELEYSTAKKRNEEIGGHHE